MSHELFMDLSDEQQELVSGGGQLTDLFETDFTAFEFQNVEFQKNIESGPDGSNIMKSLETNFVNTYAYEDLELEFGTPPVTLPGA